MAGLPVSERELHDILVNDVGITADDGLGKALPGETTVEVVVRAAV